MVKQLKFNPHWTEILGQSLGQFGSGALEGYGTAREQQELAQQQLVDKEARRKFYSDRGLDPNIEDYPQAYQNQYFKSLFREPGILEQLMSGAGRTISGQPYQNRAMSRPAQQGQPQTINIGGQEVPTELLSDEQLQSIQQAQQDSPSWLQSALGFGTGGAAGLLQKRLGFAPDLFSLGMEGLKQISPNMKESAAPIAEGLRAKIQEEMNKENPNEHIIEDYQNKLKFFENHPEVTDLLSGIQSVVPTTENTIKLANYAAEKAGLGEYFGQAPRSEMLGAIAGTFTDPNSWKQGIPSILKDAMKAAGISWGGELTKNVAEELTGSEKVGRGAQGAFYLLASVFPGIASTMAKGRYNQVEAVAKQAAEEGKLVNMQPYQEEFNQIKDRIEDVLTAGTREQPRIATPEYLALSPHVNRLESNIFNRGNVNPEELLRSSKSMSEQWNKIPKQARDFYQDLINLQRKAAGSFLDTVKPGSSKLLKEANSLWRTNAQATKAVSDMGKHINYRNMGAGTLLLLMGGLKAVIPAVAGVAGGKYISHMLRNPVIRQTMGQLAKASATGNVSRINSLYNKLNTEGERIMKKLPEKEREQIQSIIDQVKSGAS